MPMPRQPWREGLGPASFRGAFFHVDVQAVGGGRRIAMHEYPKRDTPYAEDMGKRSANFRVTAYCIGPNYLDERDRLRRALDQEGAGQLTLPVMQSMQVVCESYTVAEQRERGGFCTFEMHFMEAGVAGFSQVAQDTNSLAKGAASTSDAAAAATLNSKLAAAP